MCPYYYHSPSVLPTGCEGQPKVMLDASRGEDSTDLLDVKDELTFYQYKVCKGNTCLLSVDVVLLLQPYNVVLVNKVRSNSDIILGMKILARAMHTSCLPLFLVSSSFDLSLPSSP